MSIPTVEEQRDIDRFGMFDEERFAEIVDSNDLEPKCGWWAEEFHEAECGEPATHITRCKVCNRLGRLVCQAHAERIATDAGPCIHEACRTRLPLRQLMSVRKL